MTIQVDQGSLLHSGSLVCRPLRLKEMARSGTMVEMACL